MIHGGGYMRTRAVDSLQQKPIRLEPGLELSLGSAVGQLRAVPVILGTGEPPAVLVAYCADFDVDPFVEMFFFPRDTLKFALFTMEGEILWQRDLGPGVVPGMWFCPFHAFDLDGDGVDEIWFVNNVNSDHPLGLSGYRLERLDASTGGTTGQWQWPAHNRDQSLSSTFRNFIAGGHVRGEPVLVTAQGTYGDMFLQGWRQDMSPRWEHVIRADDPGARGSHMCPITDLDGDGVEEIMWGERCIELNGGRELFCADRDAYAGHSDVIQPVLDWDSGRWYVYTCREGHGDASPRVVLFDARGQRVWGDLDHGHIDMGWVARLGQDGRHLASAIRIGRKTCGPDGRFYTDIEQFTYDVLTGERIPLPFSTYRTMPVDLNGDGCHELVRGQPSGDGEVLDRRGKSVGTTGGPVALARKIMDHPGEQMLSYHPDGTVRVWVDRNAEDTPLARRRYQHPFYRANSCPGGL
jgi:hypothetical protein